MTWGLAYAVATLHGEIVAGDQPWFMAHYANTGVLGATAVVEAQRALLCALAEKRRKVLIVSGCDNLQAAEALAQRKWRKRGGDELDKVIADDVAKDKEQTLVHFWGPAQHDPGDTRILLEVNQRVDSRARAAARALLGKRWKWFEAWQDGNRLACHKDGILVLCVKSALRGYGQDAVWKTIPSESGT